MRTLYLLIFLLSAGTAFAQPTVLGSSIVDGSYSTTNLNSVAGFKQIRLQATSSSATGIRIWEFAQGTAAATDYSTNWRPYTNGNTMSVNNFIPTSYDNGARYNSGFGGQSGLLPDIIAGDYYTFNVSNNALADNIMSLLETDFNPADISAVSQNPAVPFSITPVVITVTMASAPAAGENVYVRYTTDNFATSVIVQCSFAGSTGMATIPAQPNGTTVNYYVYSSNRAAAAISADVTTYGPAVHDMSTLKLNNNGGPNYTYTVTNIVAVTLAAVSAVRQPDKTIMVKWNAENETGIDHYEVQRSADGSMFNVQGSRLPISNNGTSTIYSFIDNNPLGADNYYRVQAINKNNSIQYSAIVKVNAQSKNARITLFPIPVTGSIINLAFDNEPAGKYFLRLIDQNGKTIFTQTLNTATGNEVKILNLDRAPAPGIYVLAITGPGGLKERDGVMVE